MNELETVEIKLSPYTFVFAYDFRRSLIIMDMWSGRSWFNTRVLSVDDADRLSKMLKRATRDMKFRKAIETELSA